MLDQDEGREDEDDAVNHCAAVPVKIEQLTKDFKTHWCALDFDKGSLTWSSLQQGQQEPSMVVVVVVVVVVVAVVVVV